MQRKMILVGNFLFSYRNIVFPLTILGLLSSGFLLNANFENTRISTPLYLAAYFFAFIGLSIRAFVLGYTYIKCGGVNKKFYADQLVINGMFAVCRNPLYLGNIFNAIAFFLMCQNVPIIILGTILSCLTYQCLVYAEENFLRKQFGNQYIQYCRLTPRWIPKIFNIKNSMQGMSFNFMNVIVKGYSAMGSTIIILTSEEPLRQLITHEVNLDNLSWHLFIPTLTTICLLLFIHKLKKFRILTA